MQMLHNEQYSSKTEKPNYRSYPFFIEFSLKEETGKIMIPYLFRWSNLRNNIMILVKNGLAYRLEQEYGVKISANKQKKRVRIYNDGDEQTINNIISRLVMIKLSN